MPHVFVKELRKAADETPLSTEGGVSAGGESAIISHISGLVNADVPWALSKWDGFISLPC